MSLLREPAFMRSIISVPGNFKFSGVAGSMLVTTESGAIDSAPSLNVTPSVMSVTTKSGIYVSEATETEDPGVPVVGGGVLFVNDGKLKYRGTSGTVTTVADA